MSLVNAVCPGKGGDPVRARQLADRFRADLTDTLPEDGAATSLLLDADGITLVTGDRRLRGDFSRMLPRVTGGKLAHELLLKAAKPPKQADVPLRAFDATAGLGEDSFILAAAGYRVEMCEHNPVTALLLSDALERAEKAPELASIVSRMTLLESDSKQVLKSLTYRPDLIYLDPMYPEKKKSAESKLKLQVLHHIEAPCSDAEELLWAALGTKTKKIIVKRSPDGEFLAGMKPTYQLERKAVRFDVIVPAP